MDEALHIVIISIHLLCLDELGDAMMSSNVIFGGNTSRHFIGV